MITMERRSNVIRIERSGVKYAMTRTGNQGGLGPERRNGIS